MNYILTSVQKTILTIREHKFMVVVLLLLQILLLVSLLGVMLFYQVRITENAFGIIEPLQRANYQPEELEAGQPFSTELLEVYQQYRALIQNVVQFLLSITALYLLLNGVIWVVSQHLAAKKLSWRDAVRCWLKFSTLTFLFLTPFFILAYFILKSMIASQLSVNLVAATVQILAYLFLAVYFFLLIAFAFIAESSWKTFASRFFHTLFKKIHYVLGTAVILTMTLALSIYAIYITINREDYFYLMILASVVLMVLVVTLRLFWIITLQVVTHETHSS